MAQTRRTASNAREMAKNEFGCILPMLAVAATTGVAGARLLPAGRCGLPRAASSRPSDDDFGKRASPLPSVLPVAPQVGLLLRVDTRCSAIVGSSLSATRFRDQASLYAAVQNGSAVHDGPEIGGSPSPALDRSWNHAGPLRLGCSYVGPSETCGRYARLILLERRRTRKPHETIVTPNRAKVSYQKRWDASTVSNCVPGGFGEQPVDDAFLSV
jgi:hypothetical protein